MYFVLFYYFYVMCLAVENWLFLTKNGFLLAIFSLLYIVSNCSFFIFFYLVSYICLYLFVCVCAVYELLAIKYNYTLNPLDFFFQTTLVLSSCTFSPRKRKKFDYKTNRFLCLLLLLRYIFSH